MDKDVRAVSAPDETIPFEVVEPFNIANHFGLLSIDLCTLRIHEELHRCFVRLLPLQEMPDVLSIAAEPNWLLEADTFGLLISLLSGSQDSYFMSR